MENYKENCSFTLFGMWCWNGFSRTGWK